ncbi:hypothetical protein KCU87_g125, partial [Aureobasidium melanogenum]
MSEYMRPTSSGTETDAMTLLLRYSRFEQKMRSAGISGSNCYRSTRSLIKLINSMGSPKGSCAPPSRAASCFSSVSASADLASAIRSSVFAACFEDGASP